MGRPGKRKTIRKSINKPTEISVLTFNVCWECMSGTAAPTKTKAYGKKCGKSNPNKCRENAIEICSSNPFSFIALQEAELDLADDIIQDLKKKGHGNYSKVVKVLGKTKAIIIYNRDLFKKDGNLLFGNIIEKGRPYLFHNFIHKKTGKSLIVGTIHGPHEKRDWVKDYVKVAFALKGAKEKNPKILIMGDFNREIKKNITFGRDYNFNSNLTVLNKGQIKTGWNIDGKSENYNLAVDHIIISDSIKVVFGPETVGDDQNVLLPRNTRKKYTNMTSDHKPLTAIISF